MTVHPIFQNILDHHRNSFGPGPSSTIATMQAILQGNLDTLERLESDIAELEADLRDASNDWAHGSALLKLTAARADQAQLVAQAARDLRTIETLRERNGMEPTTLGRIFNAMQP